MKKILPITLALIVALSLMITAVAEEDTYSVRIAYGPGLCHAALHVAIEKGFFDEVGLNYTLKPMDISLIPDAAATNTIDASQGMVGKWGIPLENGLGIQIVTGLHKGCSRIVVRADSGINTIADLKGKRIGVPALADPVVITFRRSLAFAGLGYKEGNLDAEFVVFNSADLANALTQGAIDAYAGGDPAIAITSEEFGFKTLLNVALDEPFVNEYCCIGFVTNEFADAHPTLAAKYVAALNKAAQWVHDNPLETAQLQIDKEYIPKSDDQTAQDNAAYLTEYDFRPSIQGGYDAILNVLYALKGIELLKPETDYLELANASFTAYGETIENDADQLEVHINGLLN